jgi:hypothetical protein
MQAPTMMSERDYIGAKWRLLNQWKWSKRFQFLAIQKDDNPEMGYWDISVVVLGLGVRFTRFHSYTDEARKQAEAMADIFEWNGSGT